MRRITRIAHRIALAAALGAGALGPATTGAALPGLIGNDGTPSLAPVLREVTPAVVNIAVSARSAGQGNPLLRDPFFRRFFDLPEARRRPQQSAGSGVIVDSARGYILTNHHVIENAEQVLVTLKDRRRLQAKLVGSDPGTDIAVLQVEASGLTALDFGDSEALEVGDFVLAIGNPFGLGQTVTSGIVSALGRSGLNIEGYEDFIQTDASINPGNSGGALVDLNGRLIGINTAIIGPSGGNVGIGFAVPSNMARAVMRQLVEHGEVRRGRLGVLIGDITPELAEALGVESDRGAVISRVEPGSPAANAGLAVGDVVTEVDGVRIDGSTDLRNRVGLTRAGQEIELTVLRGRERRRIRTRVGGPGATPAPTPPAVPQLSGATVRDLTSGDPQHGRVEGVLIESVERGSPAARFGLRRGDVIMAVNRRRVTTTTEFSQALTRAGRVLAFDVLRDNATVLIVIQ